jgi:hypothetical protein
MSKIEQDSLKQIDSKRLSLMIEICDYCPKSVNDIVDGEVPCRNKDCPCFKFAVQWLKVR